VIEVTNLHKQFGPQVVLKGVNLKIPDGMTTAVVGPSGAGKSVLLKIIMGIEQADRGSVLVNEQDIGNAKTEKEKNEIRKDLGVLFQAAALFDSLTVAENIAFPLQQRAGEDRSKINEKVAEMLEALSLEEYARSYPEEISIGIRKRVGMARALITKPSVVLFDEPNTGLDPLVGQEVYDLIKDCRKRWGFTGVVISHELPEVFQVSDRVAMLLNGQIIFEGSPKQLIESDDLAVQQFLNGRIDGPIKIR